MVLVVPSYKLLVLYRKQQYITYSSSWAFLAQQWEKNIVFFRELIFLPKRDCFNVAVYEVNKKMFLCWNNLIIINHFGEDIFLTLNHILSLSNIN